LKVLGFDFPDALHYHVEHQVWARHEADGQVTVGITALGIKLSGEIYMCRAKGVGQAVEQGRSVAVVELAKAIVAVKSPVSGTVVAVNEALASRPELVHTDPYGEGWIARLTPSAWEAERAALVHGDAVAEAMRHHAWLNNVEPA
jgi:glycine cleavage system H protein